MMREQRRNALPGLPVLLLLLLGLVGCVLGVISAARAESLVVIAWLAGLLLGFTLLGGLFTVGPNEARVLQLFGRYEGTVVAPGLRWANPFYTKRRISLRVRNFETAKLKVNDQAGNPIEIAAIVVWKVVDTAEACFQVDDYENYVHVQSESAVRVLASSYPYDAHQEGDVALRGHADIVSEKLKAEIHERLKQAGVHVVEARISHLAYAPEIAAAMLQRQQASAIIAARQLIVDGAVGMVEMALARLARENVVHLDEERKAAMVSNLLVVLCSERAASPVVNTGSLYQ